MTPLLVLALCCLLLLIGPVLIGGKLLVLTHLRLLALLSLLVLHLPLLGLSLLHPLLLLRLLLAHHILLALLLRLLLAHHVLLTLLLAHLILLPLHLLLLLLLKSLLLHPSVVGLGIAGSAGWRAQGKGERAHDYAPCTGSSHKSSPPPPKSAVRLAESRGADSANMAGDKAMGNGLSVAKRRAQTFGFLASVALVGAPVPQAHAQSVEAVGGVAGGGIGGWIANKLGGDEGRALRTAIGVGIGAFVGSRIGKGLTKRDKEQVAALTKATMHTGQAQAWTGSKKGVSGRTELTATERRSQKVEVPVIKERVTKLPPLDFINANYAAVKKDIVRGGPGTDYKEVAKLKKGEVVSVTGKVQNQPWYLVAQNGVGVGFVSEKTLAATTAQPEQLATATGTVESKPTEVTRTCRTVKQTVVQNGKEVTENVTACQTANGWDVV